MASKNYTLFTPENDYVADGLYEVVFEYTNGYNIVADTCWNEMKGKVETYFIPRQGIQEWRKSMKINCESVSYKSLNAAQKFLKEQGAVVEAVQEQLTEEQAPHVETAEQVEDDCFANPHPLTIFFYYAAEIAKKIYSDEQKARWAEQAKVPQFSKWDGRQFVPASPDEATSLKLCNFDFIKTESGWKSNSLPELGDYTERRLGEIRALGFPCEMVSEKKRGFEKSWRTYSIVIPLDAFKSTQDITPEPGAFDDICYKDGCSQEPMNACSQCHRAGCQHHLTPVKNGYICDDCKPVEDDDDLSPEDLAAIDEALNQESMGPFTMAELAELVEQNQSSDGQELEAKADRDEEPTPILCALCDADLYEGHEHTCRKCKRQVCDFDFRDMIGLCNECHIAGLSTGDLKALRDAYERTRRRLTEAEDMFYHEVTKEIEQREQARLAHLANSSGLTDEEQALLDAAYTRTLALGRPFQQEEIFQEIWDTGLELVPQMDSRFILVQEATGRTARLWGVKSLIQKCTRCKQVVSEYVIYPVGSEYPIICNPCEAEESAKLFARLELERAREDRYQHFHDGLSAFCQAVGIIAYMQTDAFELCGPFEVIEWEKAGKLLEAWLERQPSEIVQLV